MFANYKVEVLLCTECYIIFCNNISRCIRESLPDKLKTKYTLLLFPSIAVVKISNKKKLQYYSLCLKMTLRLRTMNIDDDGQRILNTVYIAVTVKCDRSVRECTESKTKIQEESEEAMRNYEAHMIRILRVPIHIHTFC